VENREILAGVLVLQVIPDLAKKLQFQKNCYLEKRSTYRNFAMILAAIAILTWLLGSLEGGYIFAFLAFFSFASGEFPRGVSSGFALAEADLQEYLRKALISLEYEKDSVSPNFNGQPLS
jgi:hypothetical protein